MGTYRKKLVSPAGRITENNLRKKEGYITNKRSGWGRKLFNLNSSVNPSIVVSIITKSM